MSPAPSFGTHVQGGPQARVGFEASRQTFLPPVSIDMMAATQCGGTLFCAAEASMSGRQSFTALGHWPIGAPAPSISMLPSSAKRQRLVAPLHPKSAKDFHAVGTVLSYHNLLEPSFHKRDWVYGGLAHPPGVVLGQASTSKRLPPGSTLIVAGDQHAWGLSPFLEQLAEDGSVSFKSDAGQDEVCLERWVEKLVALGEAKPTMALVSVSACEVESATLIIPELRDAAASLRAAGTTVVWIRPPELDLSTVMRKLLAEAKIPSFHSEAIDVHRSEAGSPSARGYAGWAGAIWRWIG